MKENECNCTIVTELRSKITELEGIIIRLQCDLEYYKKKTERDEREQE